MFQRDVVVVVVQVVEYASKKEVIKDCLDFCGKLSSNDISYYRQWIFAHEIFAYQG